MTAPGDLVDVVVIGAGLAGLRCAADLTAAGLDVMVLEQETTVGGRVRTEQVDGFLVDRGFQLLNPAYSALSDVDVDALDLQPFGAGVAARVEDGLVRLGHPRAVRLLPSTVAYAARHPGEVLALLRWVRPLLHRPGSSLATHLHDLVEAGRLAPSLAGSWNRAGLDGRTRRVVERFLAGVLLDHDAESPADLALLLVAAFLRGTPGLPAHGMQALPALLAADVPHIRLSARACLLGGGEGRRLVRTEDSDLWSRAVVVATDAADAATLLDRSTARSRGVATAWFAVPDDVPRTDLLHVDARVDPRGPVVNTAVVSDAAPSYAPAGRRLVQASTVIPAGATLPALSDVRRHAGDLLGCDTSAWELLACHEVRHALPDPGRALVRRRPVRLGDGLYVCGDHRDTPSIQGALVSGRRAARAALSDLGRPSQRLDRSRSSTNS